MPFRTDAKHLMLDALAGELTEVSLHDAYPPSDTNELADGVYTRQPVTFTAAGAEAAGQVDHDAVTLQVGGGSTVAAVAYRDSLGAILVDSDVTDESYALDGEYVVTADSNLNLNG